MSRDSVLAVIPARFGASRFPGKPLAMLWGKPLIRHVWERGRAIAGIDALAIATDDARIAEVARGFGAAVEMTSADCASGTDRVAAVARRMPEHGVVINLQGDEPELDPAGAAAMVAGMRADPSIAMATLAHAERDPAILEGSDVVKVGVDERGFALYFSRRSPAEGEARGRMLRHVGIYGFRRPFLLEFASWRPGAAERRERLEQLRAVERGMAIRVFESGAPGMGVDTPEQLALLERRGPRS